MQAVDVGMYLKVANIRLSEWHHLFILISTWLVELSIFLSEHR